MFNSIRTKLTITYLTLIMVVMVLTSFLLLNILETYYIAHQYEAVTRAANVVARFSTGYIRSTQDVVTVSNFVRNYALEYNVRVLVTDNRQRVLGDSERVDGLAGTTLEREEIAQALSGRVGQSIQYSEHTQTWVMQVAVPVSDGNEIIGTVFIASSLDYIYVVLGNIRKFLLLATVLSLLFAGLLGILFAHRITVPIESLTTASRQMTKGDLTQRVSVRSKDEIGQLGQQFNEMAGRLQEMTRQLREFVSNASHELRTPLTSLNILVKSLREYPLDEEEREEFLEDIDQELERMIHLVESLLDLTRLDRLAAEDTMAMADVVPTIQHTLEMLQKKAQEKGITLNPDLPPKAAPVFAVLHQVKQIVFNLVDNAIKYSPPGSLIHVSLTQEEERLVLKVADNGIGIPPEHRDKIFERFYRVDKARSREHGGTGLGLAIVREIIQRHGGSIWVEETDSGRGTTFIVTLPRADRIQGKY
jgi:signal transduction histidine kinase